MNETISQIVHESIAVNERLLDQVVLIRQITDMLVTTLRDGRKILLCGNGGSAADAQHVAAELVGRFKLERPAWAAIALTTDTSILTAIGNDYSYDQVFARQVEGLAQAGDVVAGITTSGNSANVLLAMQVARERGCVTLGFTGNDGGKLKDVVDLCFIAPADNTARTQEAQMLVWHIVCELLERTLVEEQ